MAQLVLSTGELIAILRANALMPEPVTNVQGNGREIRITVRTSWPVLKSIHVRARFVGFERGEAIFQVATNRFMDTFEWLIDGMLDSLGLERYSGRWEYPRLYIAVNELVARRVCGIRVERIHFEDGCFHVTTAHTNDGDGSHPHEAEDPGSSPG